LPEKGRCLMEGLLGLLGGDGVSVSG
jgi:hypothetical protein